MIFHSRVRFAIYHSKTRYFKHPGKINESSNCTIRICDNRAMQHASDKYNTFMIRVLYGKVNEGSMTGI